MGGVGCTTVWSVGSQAGLLTEQHEPRAILNDECMVRWVVHGSGQLVWGVLARAGVGCVKCRLWVWGVGFVWTKPLGKPLQMHAGRYTAPCLSPLQHIPSLISPHPTAHLQTPP